MLTILYRQSGYLMTFILMGVDGKLRHSVLKTNFVALDAGSMPG
jgi:hypothetical protein